MGLILAYKKSTAVPQFSGNPSYSGSLLVGQTLTGSYSITNAASSVTVSWMSYATIEKLDPIERATTAQYTILEADAGRYLEWIVTATNNAGESIGYSGLTPQVVDDVSPTPEFTVGATVAGQPKVGATLTANYTVLNADSVAIQWQSSADNETFGNISGATSQAFVPTGDEQGDYLRVVVTATNGSGSTVSTSAATGLVAAADAELPRPAGAPAGAIKLDAANVASRTLSDGAVLLKGDGAYYYCVGDMTFAGAAFVINHRNITLDLNGCTVTYNTSGSNSEYGSLLPGTYDDNTFDGYRRYADRCIVNNNGIWAPSSTFDTAYSGDSTPGGAVVTAEYNRDHSGFVLKNGTLKSDAAGHLAHAVACHTPATVQQPIWTLSNVRIECGAGIHSRCVVGLYMALRMYDSSCISKSRSWFRIKDRNALAACVQVDKKASVIERCAIVGGIGGVNVHSGSLVRNTFISHYCYLTNGFGVAAFDKSGVTVEDNVILPYNGRGIYFDDGAGNSRNCVARNNVVLAWEYRNAEYGDGLTASAFKLRYNSQGHQMYGNTCLAVAGRRDGDATIPTWQGTFPITVAGPAKRTAAATMWGEAYGRPASAKNLAYNNTLLAAYYGVVETRYQYATPITVSGGDNTYGGSHDEIYANNCYGNYGMVCTNEGDGIGRSKGAHSSNTFDWQTGSDSYTAFTAAADAKLATLGLSPAVQAVVDVQKAAVYTSLAAAINQSDADLSAGRAFWVADSAVTSPAYEYVTLTDSVLGSGVDATTHRVQGVNQSHPTALRIASTHAIQLLDGGLPVASATVTVTPDQVDTAFGDVTTTTTDSDGNCTITYYDYAKSRPGPTQAALSLQTGTSSTIAVDGVGSKSVSHASLGATLDLTA